MKIRKAKKSDAKKILEIYLDDNNLIGNTESTYSLGNIIDYIKNCKLFVCLEEDEIAGVLNAEFFSEYVYLQTIVVSKKFRGKGIGGFLIRAMENEMKKGGQTFIESFTGIDNKSMQKLFEKEGYNKGKIFYYYAKNL